MKMAICSVHHTLELEDKCVGLASTIAISVQTREKSSLVFFFFCTLFHSLVCLVRNE